MIRQSIPRQRSGPASRRHMHASASSQQLCPYSTSWPWPPPFAQDSCWGCDLNVPVPVTAARARHLTGILGGTVSELWHGLLSKQLMTAAPESCMLFHVSYSRECRQGDCVFSALTWEHAPSQMQRHQVSEAAANACVHCST